MQWWANKSALTQADINYLDEAVASYIKSSNSADYLKTIVFLACHLEFLIKNKLIRRNPALLFEKIDDNVVRYLYAASLPRNAGRHKEMPTRMPKSASSSRLIERYFAINVEQKEYQPYINELFEIRNQIVHLDPVFDIEFDKISTDIRIAKAFEFLHKRSPHAFKHYNWDKIKRIIEKAGDRLLQEIQKKIAASVEHYAALTPANVKSRIDKPLNFSGLWWPRVEYALKLLCPACRNPATSLVLEAPSFEGQKSYTQCRVCNLTFNETEYKEITANPEEYSLPSGWATEAIRIVERERSTTSAPDSA